MSRKTTPVGAIADHLGLTEEERIELLDLERLRLEASLRLFIEEAWPLVEPKHAFIPGWHVDAIAEHLEAVRSRQIRDLLINIPPRHAKSIIVCVMYPAWVWTTMPQERFLCASYAASLSVRDAVKCRRLLQSRWYQDRWGDVFRLTSDQNVKSQYENDRGGGRISTSVAGLGTGAGGDQIICDDPHKLGEANSPIKRQRAVDWWNDEMSSRGNDPATSVRIVIMQRVHEGDVSGSIIEQGNYEHLMIPAEFDPKRAFRTCVGTDPRKEKGELICPERVSRADLEKLKKSLKGSASGQLQQDPSPPGGTIIKDDWIKRYKPADLPAQFQFVCVSVDLPFDEDGEDNSYAVFQVWGRKGADKYLLHQIREQMEFVKQRAAMKRAYEWAVKRGWRPNKVLVEKKANGAALISSARRHIAGMHAVEPGSKSKVIRLEACSDQFEDGNVWVPEQADWVEGWVHELTRFPKSLYNDQVDAASQALNYMEARSNSWQGIVPEGARKASQWTISPAPVY